jgi:hypothetical protein
MQLVEAVPLAPSTDLDAGLAGAPKAHVAVQSGSVIGNVVVTVN